MNTDVLGRTSRPPGRSTNTSMRGRARRARASRGGEASGCASARSASRPACKKWRTAPLLQADRAVPSPRRAEAERLRRPFLARGGGGGSRGGRLHARMTQQHRGLAVRERQLVSKRSPTRLEEVQRQRRKAIMSWRAAPNLRIALERPSQADLGPFTSTLDSVNAPRQNRAASRAPVKSTQELGRMTTFSQFFAASGAEPCAHRKGATDSQQNVTSVCRCMLHQSEDIEDS